MASYSVAGTGFPTGSGVKTLSGTTADTVTITPLARGWTVEVLNLSTSQVLGVRCDGTTAVAAAASVVRVPAGGSIAFPTVYIPGGIMSVVGNGNEYQVNLIPTS